MLQVTRAAQEQRGLQKPTPHAYMLQVSVRQLPCNVCNSIPSCSFWVQATRAAQEQRGLQKLKSYAHLLEELLMLHLQPLLETQLDTTRHLQSHQVGPTSSSGTVLPTVISIKTFFLQYAGALDLCKSSNRNTMLLLRAIAPWWAGIQ